MERACTIFASLLLVVSAVALWRGQTNAAFVLATIGALAWFVGVRMRLSRAQSNLRATETDDDDSDDSYEK